MAISIARYRFSEAQAGTGPTQVGDDTNNGNALTIDYSSGDAVWGGSASGNFLDYTAAVTTANTAKAELFDIQNNGNIGSSLDGVTECSFFIVLDVDSGSALGARNFHIGSNAGNGELALVADAFSNIVRIGGNSVAEFPDLAGAGVSVVACVIDTTQANVDDRVRIWYDDVEQTVSNATCPLNETIDANNATYSLCVGNRPSSDRNVDGRIHYFELFSDQLTSQEITDGTTNLLSNNDVPALAQTGRSITNIDGDNVVFAGQATSITGIDFDLPISSVTIGGESCTVTGTPTTTNIDVTVPATINLKWSQQYTLEVTDNTGPLTLNGVTVGPRANFEQVTYNGSAPNPVNTESFYEYAQTDAGVGNYTMISGDVLAWESQTGMTVDGQTIPVINPAATVSGTYLIWDDTLSTWKSDSTFTILNSGEIVAMTAFTNYSAAEVINHTLRTATYAKPTTNYISLYTSDPGVGDTGTEVSGGAYARVAVTAADANFTAPVAGVNTTSNAVAITFPAPSGANWGTITHVGIHDAASGGNLVYKGTLTASKVVNDGDPAPVFNIGELTFQLV